jgi:glyoxylase-like metal-dependent hydrolase (beta-lactamase superfamily II)
MSHFSFSRRAVLAGAATTLAAPAILSQTHIARAEAPMMGATSASFNRIKLGDFEVTTLLDGNRASDGPHPIFGENQEAGAVAALMEENFLPPTRTEFVFTPVVVNTGSELVLFDTGLGGDAGSLTQQLAAAGYSPEQIDIVVITHMHPDHIGGLMTGGNPTFPNARYVTGQAEYDFWSGEDKLTGPTERVAKLVQSNVTPMAEKMTFIGDGSDVVTGITGMDTSGHTPGHMSYHIESGGQRLLIWGDVANHFVASIQRPDWHVRFDMVSADKVAVVGYHMPFPGIGYIDTRGGGYSWLPASYQFKV